MNKVPCVPATAPFTPEQRAWLNGYLAGLFADAAVGEAAAQESSSRLEEGKPLLVMYGSQTGTAEGLARRFARESEKHGCVASVFRRAHVPAFSGSSVTVSKSFQIN